MWYVEFLRVRRTFLTFAIILLAIVAFDDISIAYGMHHAVIHHDGSDFSAALGSGDSRQPHDVAQLIDSLRARTKIPLGLILGICAYLAFAFATFVSASLNKENGRGGFAFTKPVARTRLAIEFIAIDAAAILAAYALTIALVFASLALFGFASTVYLDRYAFEVAAVGLGSAFMSYGLIQAASAWRAGGGGLTVGLSWVVYFVALVLYAVGYFGPLFHDVIAFVDFFNPLAYFGISQHNDVTTTKSIFGFEPATCIAITWTLAVAACAAAVASWRRVEA